MEIAILRNAKLYYSSTIRGDKNGYVTENVFLRFPARMEKLSVEKN